MTITYHRLEPKHAQHYRAIRLESLQRHPDSFSSTYASQVQQPKLAFEGFIEAQTLGKFVMGAFDKDNLIGICGYTKDNDFELKQTGTLIQLYVQDAYRGQKVGLHLVQKTVAEALQQGDVTDIVLEALPHNIPANRVYKQAGFRHYDLIYWNHPPEKHRIVWIYRGNTR
ncbi:MAG: GNAT family N-acetyltransferase [Chloroflexota bacterium]